MVEATNKMISYAHQSDPEGPRFSQYEGDKIPDWAVDIQPYEPPLQHPTDRLVQKDTSPEDIKTMREGYDTICALGFEEELNLLIENAISIGRVS